MHACMHAKPEQCQEIVQKRAFLIIYPDVDYERALSESNLKTLRSRRDNMRINLIRIW